MNPRVTAPGPELPLVGYWHFLAKTTGEIAAEELSRECYRALVRCYALELFPTEVLSVNDWEHGLLTIPDPAALDANLAVGARIKLEDRPLLFDPWPRFRVRAKAYSKAKNRAAFIQRPKVKIVHGWWNKRFYEKNPPERDLTEEELTLYITKIDRVYWRLNSCGYTFADRDFNPRKDRMITSGPDFSKKFDKAFPGAIVMTPDGEPAWALKEMKDVTIVETERDDGVLFRNAWPTMELEVLG